MPENLNALMRFMPAAVVMFDTEMRIIAASSKWLERYNFNLSDVVGKNHYDILPSVSEEWKEVHKRCLAGATERKDKDILYLPDGRIEYVKWEISPWRNENGEIGGIILYSEITTEVERSKQQAIRLNRELHLINEVADSVFSTKDEFDLVENACKKLIEFGGYQLVWFGYAPDPEDEIQLVRPRHKFGSAVQYVDGLVIDMKDEAHRKGPTARAILNGELTLINDMANTTWFKPWAENAKKFGLNSSVTIPIKLKNNRYGVLAIYSKETNTFMEDEIAILARLGQVITFSINSVQRRYEKKVAEINNLKLIKDLNLRNKRLEEFTYVVSHNLRAKVANLIGLSDLIADEELPQSQVLSMAGDIKKIASKLDEVIKDLNATLLVEGHAILNYDLIQLDGLFMEVKERLFRIFPDNNIILNTDFSGVSSVGSDRYYLFEIILQLCQCIIKNHFNSSVQHINVTSRRDHSFVCLTIADDIARMKANSGKSSIFGVYEKYYQHFTDGGIKLFYVKALIENIGGTFSVGPGVKNEVVFTIQIPMEDMIVV